MERLGDNSERPKIHYIDFDKFKTLEDIIVLLEASKQFEYVSEDSPAYKKVKKFTRGVK